METLLVDGFPFWLMKSRGGPPFGWWYLEADPLWLMNSRGGLPILRGGPPLGTISMDLAVCLTTLQFHGLFWKEEARVTHNSHEWRVGTTKRQQQPNLLTLYCVEHEYEQGDIWQWHFAAITHSKPAVFRRVFGAVLVLLPKMCSIFDLSCAIAPLLP